MNDLRIGCLVDTDMSHYSFARSSGLPAGYFSNQPRWRVAQWVAIALLAVVLATVISAAY